MNDITRISSHVMHSDESCDTAHSHVDITQNELFIGATLLGHITHSMRDIRWLRLVDLYISVKEDYISHNLS